MKSTNTRQSSPLAARALKFFALVFILSFFVDVAILMFPFNYSNRPWFINFVSQLVDRGIVPMVGIAFAIVGFWIDGVSGISRPKRKMLQDIRFWLLSFSIGLGAVFFLMFFLHLNNVRLERRDALTQISQQATQAETQLANQLGTQQAQSAIQQRKTQIKSQLSSLLGNQEQLQQLLNSEQLQPELKELLEKSKTNPGELDKFLQEQFNPQALRDRGLGQIRGRKQQLEDQAKTNSIKSAIRTGLSSLLLSIGYLSIGWTGLMSMKGATAGRKTSKK